MAKPDGRSDGADRELVALVPPSPAEAGPDPDEIGQEVRRAQNKLLALARTAQVTGDPSGPVLDALASQLGAQHRMTEAVRADLATLKAPTGAVFSDKQVEEMGRRLAGGCEVWAGSVRKALTLQSAALVVAAVAVTLVVGIGIGRFWLAPSAPEVTSCVRAPQPSGGEAYSCVFWVHPPTPAVR